MIVFGVIDSSCILVHLCLGEYCRLLWRKLISFLISSWCFSTLFFPFFGPRAVAGTVVEQEWGIRCGATVIILVVVYFVFYGIVIIPWFGNRVM